MKNVFLATCLLLCIASIGRAQEGEKSAPKNDKIVVEIKDDAKPDVYIDGKKYDYAIFELLDQSKIESVDVIKGDKAIEEYNAPNGVVLIKTVKNNSPSVIVESADIESDPLVIIDGKKSDKEALTKMSPDNIVTIDVLKGDKAVDEYNSPNGVIIVTTKKKK